jgi:GT2 family glycosyltransferase
MLSGVRDMLISVIIPTRHRNDLLSLCLDRVAPGAQSVSADKYEVIVTDDGAQTTAQGLVAERYPWARWTQGPRRGPAANRNHGVRQARGEFIAFTDDDCLPSPGWLAAFAAAIRPDVDVYEGMTTCAAGIRSPLEQAPVNLSGGCLWSCNVMVRAEVFGRLGGFDEDFPNAWCEDVEFFDRVNRNGIAWRFVPEAVIDHPVRRQRIGWSAGMQWKARVLLWYKQGHETSTWKWLPVHLLKVRIHQVLQFPFTCDSVLAYASIVMEFACVLCGLASWESEYQPLRTRSLERRRQEDSSRPDPLTRI